MTKIKQIIISTLFILNALILLSAFNYFLYIYWHSYYEMRFIVFVLSLCQIWTSLSGEYYRYTVRTLEDRRKALNYSRAKTQAKFT